MRKGLTFLWCITGIILSFGIDSFAAVGDRWHSGKQYHCSAAGSPIVDASNPLSGNAWEYVYRMARGYNDGKWKIIGSARIGGRPGDRPHTSEASAPNFWVSPFRLREVGARRASCLKTRGAPFTFVLH